MAEKIAGFISKLISVNTIVVLVIVPLQFLSMIVFMILAVIPAAVLSVIIVPIAIFQLLRNILLIIREQRKLIKMILNRTARPQSANEIISFLNAFDSEIVKTQFARYLPKWLPTGTDWNMLIDKAKSENGYVRDALFQLCELWQDTSKE